MKKCCDFLVNNMAIFVVLIGIVGAVWPQTLQWVKPYVGWLLGIVMFGMGMTLTVQDFKTVFKRPWEVLIGVVAQFVIMSTTLLAPIVTPTLTWFLAGAWIHVSFVSMMISIAEMVLVPVLLGLAVHHFFARGVEKVLPAMPVISVVTIIILVGCVVSLSASRLFDVGLLMAAIVILHNAFGLALGYSMAKLFRLDSRKSRTVAIEVGMQNSGMAASLAVLYFNPAAAIPGAIFSVWHNISGSIIANFFSRRDEKAEEKARALSVDKSSVPTH